jgi:DNA-directed RNA polymerase specialized sigma24 family protein
MTDRIRRGRIVSIDYVQDSESLNVRIDELSPERRLSAHQELGRLSEAFDTLSDDCREVVWLRRVVGLSQREVAERLGMREGTLESHLCRGVRALTVAVYGGPDGEQDGARGQQHDSEQGQRSNRTRGGTVVRSAGQRNVDRPRAGRV